MEHFKKYWPMYLFILLVLIAAIVIYRLNKSSGSTDGNSCTVGGFPGKIKNGVCVKIGVGSGNQSF